MGRLKLFQRIFGILRDRRGVIPLDRSCRVDGRSGGRADRFRSSLRDRLVRPLHLVDMRRFFFGFAGPLRSLDTAAAAGAFLGQSIRTVELWFCHLPPHFLSPHLMCPMIVRAEQDHHRRTPGDCPLSPAASLGPFFEAMRAAIKDGFPLSSSSRRKAAGGGMASGTRRGNPFNEAAPVWFLSIFPVERLLDVERIDVFPR